MTLLSSLQTESYRQEQQQEEGVFQQQNQENVSHPILCEEGPRIHPFLVQPLLSELTQSQSLPQASEETTLPQPNKRYCCTSTTIACCLFVLACLCGFFIYLIVASSKGCWSFFPCEYDAVLQTISKRDEDGNWITFVDYLYGENAYQINSTLWKDMYVVQGQDGNKKSNYAVGIYYDYNPRTQTCAGQNGNARQGKQDFAPFSWSKKPDGERFMGLTVNESLACIFALLVFSFGLGAGGLCCCVSGVAFLKEDWSFRRRNKRLMQEDGLIAALEATATPPSLPPALSA